MNRSILLFFLLCTAVAVLSALNYTPTELIVKTTHPIETRANTFDIPELDVFLSSNSVKEIKRITPGRSNNFFVVRLEVPYNWEELKQRNMEFPGVEYIQPNYLNEFLYTPNDPLYSQQNLDLMKIPEAWQYETGSNQVVVALVDSGIWFEHPEFICESNIWINESEYPPNGEDSSGNGYIDDWRGWDFVDAPELAEIALGDYLDQDNNPTDESGHGTHIAGIIGAKSNNNEGISGVCWDVKLMILRAGFRTTTGSGYLQDDDVSAAIIYAADNGAHIINASWGSNTYSQIIADACQYAYDRGVIIVASAGNEPQPTVMYPAKLNTTIAVGAVDNNLNLTGFSSYGPDLDIVAPGQNILSTYIEQDNEIYRKMSGTSMSSPFVSAAIALLLSREPGLSFDEVKARLYTSAKDLGDKGFDNKFGNGLLDVENLLANSFNPYIVITSPPYNIGISQSFDIIGSVTAPDFFQYSVMFTDVLEPLLLDWKDVHTHSKTPTYYRNEVLNDKIAHFLVPSAFKDGRYLIRVKVDTTIGRSYEKRFRVTINQNIPSLKENGVKGYKRYRDDLSKYYLEVSFNQEVFCKLIVSDAASEYSVYSNYADSTHVLKIPDSIAGDIDIRFEARNFAGLVYESPSFNQFMEIEHSSIATDMMTQTPIGTSLIAVGKSHDFDNDGFLEFVGWELLDDNLYGKVKFFELQGDVMVEKYAYEEDFLPLDLGNTNTAGKELFGLALDSGRLYETMGDSTYPNIPIWNQNGVLGGNFFDISGNGIDELVLIKNLSNQRVITVNKRNGNFFVEQNILFNTTDTFERNTFFSRVAVADLNNNGFQNILASDSDGDILVYEIYSPNAHELIFTHRLPVRNADYISIGDFTGNGKLEFCAGGYSFDYSDPNKTFSYFKFFQYNSVLNDFESIGYISFDHFERVNSVKAIDIRGDGKKNLILALTPHLFIIDFVDNEFKPIWKGYAAKTYQIIPIPNSDSSSGFIVNNYMSGTKVLQSELVTLSEFTGPPPPTGLSVVPLNDSSVRLNWDLCDAEYYEIYRKHNDNISKIDSTLTNNYLDIGLQNGEAYFYSLRKVHSGFSPTISNHSPWKKATPSPPPALVEAEMISLYELRLLFNSYLSNEAINIGIYTVNNDIGKPSSVNHIAQQKGLILRFNTPFTETNTPYTIEINGLTGSGGVLMPHSFIELSYTPHFELFSITDYRIEANRRLIIYFNNILDKDYAETIGNYELKLPAIDFNNSINNIYCADDNLTIDFATPLQVSNEYYYLKLIGLRDINGKIIPNNQNIVRFNLSDFDNLDSVSIVPNPFIKNKPGHNHLEFIGLPLNKRGKLAIYSLSGEIVYHSNIQPLTERDNIFKWNGVNNANKALSSGMYFYLIQMGDYIKRGQLAIIN